MENLISKLSGETKLDTAINILILAVIAGVIITVIVELVKFILKQSRKTLLIGLVVITTLMVVPRISAFIIGKIGSKNFLVRNISRAIDEDIERKIRLDYQMKNGYRLDESDHATVEAIKQKEYAIDPSIGDEGNMLRHSGFPKQITEGFILAGLMKFSKNTVHADNYPDFAAQFVVSRFITFVIYAGVFLVLCKVFLDRDPAKKYLK